MKKFTKIVLIASLSLFLFGVLFMIIGGVMGGKNEFVKHIKSKIYTYKEDIFDDHKESNAESNMGSSNIGAGEVNFDFSDIKKLEMEVDFATIFIKTWNQDTIGVKSPDDIEEFICENRDGTLYINDTTKKFFEYNDQEITILIPKDYEFQEVKLDIGGAEIYIEELIAENGSFDIGAGLLEGNRIRISDKTTIDMGAGSMDLEQFEGKFLDVKCGVGEVEIEGIIRGDSKIKTDVGLVSFSLAGREEDYNYNIKSGLGDVDVNEASYGGIAQERKIENGSSITLELECNVGEIELEFDE